MSDITVQRIPPSAQSPTRPTAQRIAASARGIEPCGRCRMVVCDACHAIDAAHIETVYAGGHGYVVVAYCHSKQACRARGGMRA